MTAPDLRNPFYFDPVTWFDSPDAKVPISLSICWAASSKKKWSASGSSIVLWFGARFSKGL